MVKEMHLFYYSITMWILLILQYEIMLPHLLYFIIQINISSHFKLQLLFKKNW